VRGDEARGARRIHPGRPHLDPRSLFLEPEDDVVVEPAPSAVHRLDRDLLGQVRHRHRNVELAGKLGREADVLSGESQAEHRRVVLAAEHGLRHPLVEVVHAPERASSEPLPDRLGLDARLDAERERLGHGLADAVADHVVHELADRARADRPRVEHLVPDGIEDRLHALVDGPVAPHHHRQVARRGAGLAPADRSVEHVEAHVAESRLQPADERRPAGRGVDPDASPAHGVEERGRHRLDLGGAGQGGERHVGEARHLGDRRRRPGAARREVAHDLRPEIVDHQRKARLEKITCHAATHVPQSDQPDGLHAASYG
jgi:hypothetical protein